MAGQKDKSLSKTPTWPSADELKRVRRLLARKAGTEGLRPDATAMDRAKWDLCAEFVKYIRSEEISQRELAKRLAVSEARVSEIVHYRLRKLTAEQLLRYLERIKPNFRLRVA
jgi:predicted XRE-type DNA-binding protein